MEKKVMQYTESEHAPFRKYAVNTRLLGGLALLLCAAGCGSETKTSGTTPTAPTQGPQSYFAPYVVGTTNGGSSSPGVSQIYAIDDSAATFSQSTFQLQLPTQQGPQVINVGVIAPAQRGLLGLGITTNYTNPGNAYVPTTFNPPKLGSFAVELAGQAGGLVQLVGQPAEPLVAAVQCPNLKSAQTYQFVTIPAPLIDSSSAGLIPYTWDPKLEAAYGNVDISSNGNNVTFDNIRQSTLPPPAERVPRSNNLLLRRWGSVDRLCSEAPLAYRGNRSSRTRDRTPLPLRRTRLGLDRQACLWRPPAITSELTVLALYVSIPQFSGRVAE
jgi:hypothetical protein